MMRVLLHGAAGHMGRMVAEVAAQQDNIQIAAGVDSREVQLAFPCYTALEQVSEKADAIIDFSLPAAVPSVVSYAVEKRLPLVIATTGLTAETEAQIEQAAQIIPVFRSANFSLGVYALGKVMCLAAELLQDADVEIVETHHRRKQDAPSGTALTLAKMLQRVKAESSLTFGREGKCPRNPGEIGIHAVRGGTVAGIHEVHFFGNDESLTLTHTAASRSIFADGALKAAAYLVTVTAPGIYGMDDLMRI